jgi:FixJ family two-component response regulator
VTSHADAATQRRAIESGANDFIAKPFLPIEITVKALTFAWENRLQKPDKAETSSAAPLQVQAAA